MPNDLDQATAAAPKNVEITSVRIPLQTLLSQTRKAREHMTTEHTVVRSGKLKRKPFNSNVAGHLLTIATFGFSYLAYRATRQASQLSHYQPFILPMSGRKWKFITGGIRILAARSAFAVWSNGRPAYF
jgi:hypothetical protein